MNIVTVLFSGAIGLLIITFFVSLLVAIVFNMTAAQKYRQKVAHLLSGIRLNKMLAALGIDKSRYLHSTNMLEIHKHMSKCKACENVNKCDDGLVTSSVSVTEISFCDNKEQLKKLIEQQQLS